MLQSESLALLLHILVCTTYRLISAQEIPDCDVVCLPLLVKHFRMSWNSDDFNNITVTLVCYVYYIATLECYVYYIATL